MRDHDKRELREYVLRWLAAEGDANRPKATALDLHRNRFRILSRALHGERPVPAARPGTKGAPEDRGEGVRIVINPPGPLR